MSRQDGRTGLEIIERLNLGEPEDQQRRRRTQRSVAQELAERFSDYAEVIPALCGSGVGDHLPSFGDLGSYLDRYADWLSEQGFCRVHARLQLVRIADFSLWLDKRGLTIIILARSGS